MRAVILFACGTLITVASYGFGWAEKKNHNSFLGYLSWPDEINRQIQSRILSDLHDFCIELKFAVIPLSLQEREWLDRVTVLVDGRRGVKVDQSSGSRSVQIMQSSAFRRDELLARLDLCIETTQQVITERINDRSDPSFLAIGIYNLVNLSLAKDDVASGYKESWIIANSSMHGDLRFDLALQAAPAAALKLTGYIARQY